jgi:hypothetical protein
MSTYIDGVLDGLCWAGCIAGILIAAWAMLRTER